MAENDGRDTENPIAGINEPPSSPSSAGEQDREQRQHDAPSAGGLADKAHEAHELSDAAGGESGTTGVGPGSHTADASGVSGGTGAPGSAISGSPSSNLDGGSVAGVSNDGGAPINAGPDGTLLGTHGAGAAHGAVASGGGGIAAAGMNAANIAGFAMLQGVKYIVSLFGRAGSRVSEATNGRVSSLAAGTSMAGVLSLLASMFIMPMIFGGPNTVLMDDVDDNKCSTNVQNAADAAGLTDGTSGDAGQISAQKEAVAKKIAAVLRKMGMTDIEIAGAFGNMEQESGIDPTSVQGFPVSTYTMTDAKKAAAIAGANGGGIGIIQWTPENPKLRAFAQAHGKDWWDLDIQLVYMTSQSEWPGDIKAVIADHPDTLEAAESSWLKHIEKAGTPDEGNRIQKGKEWAAKIATWSSSDFDMNYANSIVSQANAGSIDAGQDGVSDALANCQSSQGTNANNSSLAQAAVSYAWPFYDQSVQDITKGQDHRGTPLYQNLHYAIWGGNNYGEHPLASCDNGVSTAVQWSGADSHIPEQGAAFLYQYFQGAGKQSGTWKEIPWDNNMSTLQPGDILSSTHHILMYTGHDIPLKFYNGDASKFETDGMMVSASHTGDANATTPNRVDRSPGIGPMQGDTYSNHDPEGGYKVFRLVKPTGSKWQGFKPSSTAVDLQSHGAASSMMGS